MDLSRVLVVGGTGKMGKYVTHASARLGHPTFVLVRDPSPSDPAKAGFLDSLQKAGIRLVTGDLNDPASLVAAVKRVDVVISVVGRPHILDQLKLLDAIKEVGTIKRFIPSEFGNHADRTIPILDEVFSDTKATVRKAIEDSGVPYTYVLSGAGASFYFPNLWQGSLKAPPRDNITIYGDGNAKVVIIDENDIGTYTILGVDDPRTENKTLYLRPEGVYKSPNELVALWEQKIGRTLEKSYIPAEELAKTIVPFSKHGAISASSIICSFIVSSLCCSNTGRFVTCSLRGWCTITDDLSHAPCEDGVQSLASAHCN